VLYLTFTDELCQLRSYWTEFHKIFIRYKGIIYAVNAHIKVVISILFWNARQITAGRVGNFVTILPQNWLPWLCPLRYRKKKSSFSDSSRDIDMATNFVAKLWQNYLPPALTTLSFQNGMGYYTGSALGLVYLHSLSGSTVMFCYYLLGGDTVVTSGLYARLCYAFLVFLLWAKLSTGPIFTIFSSNRRYLREFSQSTPVFTIPGNQFCVVLDYFSQTQSISGSTGPIFTIFVPYGRYWISDDQSDLPFSNILRDVVMATNFVAKLPTPLYLSLQHSETEWDIATSMSELTA